MQDSKLRKQYLDTATRYLTAKMGSQRHRELIDAYNVISPLPRGYKMSYEDAWCAAFVSAIASMAGLLDIIPAECSCGKMINLFKMHRYSQWEENDAFIPQKGDLIFYNWQDDGKGDNKGAPDHVGIVAQCDGKTVVAIEGNLNHSVAYRTLPVNGRYIRGYALPNFKFLAKERETPRMEQVYAMLNDVPQWYRPTIQKLMEKGALRGVYQPVPEDISDIVINVNETYCRVLTTLDKLDILD